MKKCKCISVEFFEKIPEEDYNVKIGDVMYYQYGDIISVDDCMHSLVEIYDSEGKIVIYMLDTHFHRNFKDLIVYRKGKIIDFLKDNEKM
jgi:hypothetical protein